MIETLIKIYAFIFGLCFGSFANVVIYRLPREESVSNPPSHCPDCDHRLSTLDLIPVLSWLSLRGRCRYCDSRISWRYPAIETLCALLFLGMAYYARSGLATIPLCILAFVLLCVSFIDYETQEIPDGLLITGAVFGILWIVLPLFSGIIPFFKNMDAPIWSDALLGVLAGAAPLFLIDRLTILLTGKDGFGFGDVKLMAMTGLFLGWRLSLLSLFIAVIIAGIFVVLMLLAKKIKKSSYIPFGHFLAVGVIAALWFGDKIIGFAFPY